MIKKLYFTILMLLCVFGANAQLTIGNKDTTLIDYTVQKEYEIGGITVSGTRFFDESSIINSSGLKVGQKLTIPGDKIANAIQNLWKQGLFSDVKILATNIQGNMIFLQLVLVERPKLSRFGFGNSPISRSEE